MKKTYYLLYLVVVAVFATACNLKDDQDLFGTSSADRADEAIENYTNVLTGASNGWLMQYYPEERQVYGGWNMFVAFGTDGIATVANEFYSPDDVETGLYSVKQSAGVLLSFDTYNELFHIFADPAAPLGGDRGKGLEGDYEFLIISASAEKVVLKGKKTGGYATLTPISASRIWEDYMSDLQDAADAMEFMKFNLEMNGEITPVAVSYRTLTFTYQRDGNNVSVTVSYIITETGYKFYEPIVVNGVTLSEFTFDAGNIWFTEVSDASVKLIPVIPPLNQQFVAGNWYFAYSGLGSTGTTTFNTMRTTLVSNSVELYTLHIGGFDGGRYGLAYDGIYSGDHERGVLNFTYTLIGEDKITLSFAGTGYGTDINWYYSVLSGTIALFNGRTFTLTADNVSRPTYITLTQDGSLNNWSRMYKAPVYYPFTK